MKRLAFCALFAAPLARAQPPAPPASPLADWQQCQSLAGDDAGRLACYDRWARQQAPAAQAVAPDAAPMPPAVSPAPPTPPALATAQPADRGEAPPAAVASLAGSEDAAHTRAEDNCRDRNYSTLSRFWELEAGTDCGTFGLRGYRPLDLAFSIADGPPKTPTSPAPDHTGTPLDYQASELRVNLSLRTKLAQNLLVRGDPSRSDSLWFGYTQQSTWQIFNGDLSRPFRSTDHEPELVYAYPIDIRLPGDWRWRYAGLGLVHQSNGQSLPLSRSWNRVYLMGGIELNDRLRFTARAWQRIPENPESDDNPDIADYIGRAEFAGWWSPDAKNSFGATVRTFGRGSVRLEWLRALGDPTKSSLRFHAQLFHGYGDTLVDYNRSRTVLSVGLSLVDF